MVTNIFFGGGASNQFIHLSKVLCNGAEPNLLNCSYDGIGNTDCRDQQGRDQHVQDVGIKCKQSQGNELL